MFLFYEHVGASLKWHFLSKQGRPRLAPVWHFNTKHQVKISLGVFLSLHCLYLIQVFSNFIEVKISFGITEVSTINFNYFVETCRISHRGCGAQIFSHQLIEPARISDNTYFPTVFEPETPSFTMLTSVHEPSSFDAVFNVTKTTVVLHSSIHMSSFLPFRRRQTFFSKNSNVIIIAHFSYYVKYSLKNLPMWGRSSNGIFLSKQGRPRLGI